MKSTRTLEEPRELYWSDCGWASEAVILFLTLLALLISLFIYHTVII